MSTVEDSAVHYLKLPPFYNGSEMFMPNGQRLYWLGEIRQSTSGPPSYQNFKDIQASCLADGVLFEDPEFPAIESSLYNKKPFHLPITWLRPREIIEDPQLFVEGQSRFDVQQGQLGDCWLLAAVANLTLHRKLFAQVVPDDQSFGEDYAGVFHFRFWQYGRWVDVVIDDRLPTYNGKLVFLHSSETNEFWSALLEKAYAKLHGSYEAVKWGSTCEAMEDCTGGVAELYKVSTLPPDFFTILLKAYERNSLLGCTTGQDNQEQTTPEGLIRGHAYSVTKVKFIEISWCEGKTALLRLRNPWGNKAEWEGPWGDESPEWQLISESEKEELGLTFDADGEFWMSFKDFKKHFVSVEICNLSPDAMDPEECTKTWEVSTFEGEWVTGVTAGGCSDYMETFWKNPQYTITLTDVDEDDEENECTVIVALMQKNRRSQGLERLVIGVTLYRLPDDENVPKPLDLNFFRHNDSVRSTNHFTDLREVSARLKVEPGSYVIVPSTFDPDQEAEFLLRVFSEKNNNMIENYEDMGMGRIDDTVVDISHIEPEPTDPVREMFNDLAGENGVVDWQELKMLLNYSMRKELKEEEFSNDACKSMVAMLDKDNSGALGYEEFKELLINLLQWRIVFLLYDREGRGVIPVYLLREALQTAGYTVNARILNASARRYSSSDGYIQFDDFIMCAVRLKTMIDAFNRRSVGDGYAKFSLEEWLNHPVDF